MRGADLNSVPAPEGRERPVRSSPLGDSFEVRHERKPLRWEEPQLAHRIVRCLEGDRLRSLSARAKSSI